MEALSMQIKSKSNHSCKMSSNERESWGNQCDFFLTSLGVAVGLGNIWRFPYVAYVNGGGTFLVPYLLMLLLIGMPSLFVEQSIGQYGRVAINKVWEMLQSSAKTRVLGCVM